MCIGPRMKDLWMAVFAKVSKLAVWEKLLRLLCNVKFQLVRILYLSIGIRSNQLNISLGRGCSPLQQILVDAEYMRKTLAGTGPMLIAVITKGRDRFRSTRLRILLVGIGLLTQGLMS